MAELGWKQEATKDNPWNLAVSLKGFAGQHQGLGDNVWIGYHF